MPRLTKRADGRYQKKIILPDGSAKFIYAKTIPELNKKAKEIEAQIVTGSYISKDMRVSEWTIDWLKTYKSGLREHTKRSILSNLNLHILPILGEMSISGVKPIHCQSVINKISHQSEALQRKVLQIMKQLFETAVDNGLANQNPAVKIKIVSHSKPNNKLKFLTVEQQKALLNNITEPRAKAFCALCLFCGLRREEALGLLWTDISGNKLHVKRSVTFPSNQPDDNRELKTPAANRVIPMPPELITILNETPKKSLNVISDTRGNEMTLTSFRRMWAYAEKAVSFHVYPYMLRHSYASSLYRLGVNIKEAQYLLGHTDAKTTLNIYTHIENNDLVAAEEKLNNLSFINEYEASEKSS